MFKTFSLALLSFLLISCSRSTENSDMPGPIEETGIEASAPLPLGEDPSVVGSTRSDDMREADGGISSGGTTPLCIADVSGLSFANENVTIKFFDSSKAAFIVPGKQPVYLLDYQIDRSCFVRFKGVETKSLEEETLFSLNLDHTSLIGWENSFGTLDRID